MRAVHTVDTWDLGPWVGQNIKNKTPCVVKKNPTTQSVRRRVVHLSGVGL